MQATEANNHTVKGEAPPRTKNFQQLFKIQMMKKERKTANLNLQVTTSNTHESQLKDRSKRIINLLLSYPHKDVCLDKSIEFPSVEKEEMGKIMDRDSSTIVSVKQKTISHSQPKICDSIWRIKQLNKAFDREKLSVLQRHKEKGRKKVLTSLPSNLMANSISPLSKKQTIKHSFPVQEYSKQLRRGELKASVRYKDIPISEFIYDNTFARSENSMNCGIEKRLEEICRRKNTKHYDKLALKTVQ